MSLSKGECSDWKAWHDRMPGSKPTLHVTGKCLFPTAGYSVELERVEQGINPPETLQLKRIVHRPDSPVLQAVTEVEVRYSEDIDAAYSEVNILLNEETIPVEQPN